MYISPPCHRDVYISVGLNSHFVGNMDSFIAWIWAIAPSCNVAHDKANQSETFKEITTLPDNDQKKCQTSIETLSHGPNCRWVKPSGTSFPARFPRFHSPGTSKTAMNGAWNSSPALKKLQNLKKAQEHLIVDMGLKIGYTPFYGYFMLF